LAALSWGAGDFCGGLITRFANVLMAMLASQGIGFILTTLILIASGEPVASTESLAWAAVAGICGIAGLAFFYYALARGTMGLVAPVAALIGAGLPVLLAIVEGETPDAFRWAGIAVALIAVVLISLPPSSGNAAERAAARIDIRELPIVLLAGLGFAGFFIAIDRASDGGALWWPLAIVRVAGLTLVIAGIAFFAWRRGSGSVGHRVGSAIALDRFRASGRTLIGALPLFLVAGAGDMGGNFFFVLARELDDLSVAVVLASLYPIVTTILAAIFLRERLRPVQILGVVLAALSVPLLR
jgi:drug/metabolite transporter (DMT)-like permease